MLRKLIVAALLFFVSTTPAALAAGDPYLFDLLRKPGYKTYRTAWRAMLKPERNLPTWLVRFSERGGSAVAGPSRWVTDGARRLRHATVCRAHNCGPDYVWVLFTADGKRAWALHILPGADGEQSRWYGKPDARMRALLQRLADE